MCQRVRADVITLVTFHRYTRLDPENPLPPFLICRHYLECLQRQEQGLVALLQTQ